MKTPAIASNLSLLVFALALASPMTARADYSLKCTSSGYKHATCRLDRPGRVTLQRQISGTSCKQGRNWDYDGRQIWVDDGCSAEFRVDTSSHGNQSVKTAAGLVAAAILLGALTQSDQTTSNDKSARVEKNRDKYEDDGYFGPKHSSYVPDWMVGQFRGVNTKYDNTEVLLTIRPGGLVTALAQGNEIRGYINDDHLRVGDAVFTVNRSRDGLVTSQVGDQDNVVHYRRIN